jgi:hypothetical protein
MELELDPAQPTAVVRAVAELLGRDGGPSVDPWWQAGVDEMLGEAALVEDVEADPWARSRTYATARPRSNVGAERA